jgi:hypothetical protein
MDRVSGVRCADNGTSPLGSSIRGRNAGIERRLAVAPMLCCRTGSSECSATSFGDFYTDNFDELGGALFAINVSGHQTGSNQSVE